MVICDPTAFFPYRIKTLSAFCQDHDMRLAVVEAWFGSSSGGGTSHTASHRGQCKECARPMLPSHFMGVARPSLGWHSGRGQHPVCWMCFVCASVITERDRSNPPNKALESNPSPPWPAVSVGICESVVFMVLFLRVGLPQLGVLIPSCVVWTSALPSIPLHHERCAG